MEEDDLQGIVPLPKVRALPGRKNSACRGGDAQSIDVTVLRESLV